MPSVVSCLKVVAVSDLSREAITRQVDPPDPSHTHRSRGDLILYYDGRDPSRVALGARGSGYP